MSDSITLRREELYEQVWSEPMQHIARRYGLSDVALGKICRRLAIPLPGRGHWAKVAAGHEVKRPPLRAAKTDQPCEYTIERIAPRDSAIDDDRAALKAKIGPIAISEELSSAHPLVAATQRILKSEAPDDDGRLRPRVDTLDIQVGPETLNRALLIIDAVLKALETQGFPVSITPEHDHDTVATIEGQHIAFSLSEGLVRSRQLPSQYDVERLKRDRNAEIYPRWGYEPTGQLRLRIKEYLDGCRKEWADGKSRRVEDKLSEFIVGLITAARAKREWHERIERERREREEARQREAETQAKREEEKQRVESLMSQVDRWQKSESLRRFVAETEQAALKKYGRIEPDSELDKWMKWALSIAERIDPLSLFRKPTPQE